MVTEKLCNLSESWVDLSQEKGGGTSRASCEELLPKWYLYKRIELASFWWWAKHSRKATSEGPTVLHICFCSLSNNSKKQLGALAQTWQQYYIHGFMVDL